MSPTSFPGAPEKPAKRGLKPRTRIARGKRPARERKTPRSKLKKQADKLWSLLVRDIGHCFLCGETTYLQAAHGFPRRYLGTRHDLRNGWCLCRGCHKTMTHHPLAWDDFLRKELGVLYDPMRAQAMAHCEPDYEALIAYFRGLGIL